jgi:hypothetical protein
MGATWDAWINQDYGNVTREGRTSRPASADPAEEEKSVWGGLMERNRQTHYGGDGFYSGEAQTVDANYVVEGLVKRGMPEHIAEGFAMNMEDESAFQSDVNERNPTVAGSRGGFGLYQLTGTRRTQYEDFAKQRGVNPGDPDAQLDFMMWELDNTEKSARNKIWGAQSAGEAGAAIVNSFLRPAQEHREKRASKYLGGPARPEPRPNKLWLDF